MQIGSKTNQSQISTFSVGQFIWWIGKVVDIDDPQKNGRVKVEIFGYYDGIEKEKLNWAMPVGSIYSASHQGIGRSPTGLKVDSVVFGFFADGDTAQNPVVLGTFYGKPEDYDTHKNAQEENAIPAKSPFMGKKPKGGVFVEPTTKFAAKYPYNHTTYTENGHFYEMDDTSGSQRFKYQHPSKTEFEIDNQGTITIHGVNDSWHMINGTMYIHMNKDMYISVTGNHFMNIDGNSTQKIKGNLEIEVDGNYDLKVKGNMTHKIGGNIKSKAGGIEKREATKIFLN